MTTKERPILFKADMVNAIISGRKTQTRRVINPQPPENRVIAKDPHGEWYAFHMRYSEVRQTGWIPDAGEQSWRCPYGTDGDLLYVRETWATAAYVDKKKPSEITEAATVPMWYRATDEHDVSVAVERGKWRPSIHMPKALSRLWLNVEEIRAERLQDITEGDAEAEGIQPVSLPAAVRDLGAGGYRPAFAKLWDSINADRGFSWESNPFVWVIKFSINHERSSLPAKEKAHGH